MRITQFNFLNQWDQLYNAAFWPYYIFASFDKSGLIPLKPEIVLGPLYRATLDLKKPLFPRLIHKEIISLRKIKRDFTTIENKLNLLSSLIRAKVNNVAACLDLAIITQSAYKQIIFLQQEHIQVKARRTKTLRYIQVNNEAFTIAQLRKKVVDRGYKKWAKKAKKQARQQEAQQHKIRQEEATKKKATRVERPRLYSQAAARKREAQEAAKAVELEEYHQSLITSEKLEIVKNTRRQQNQADDNQQSFYYSTFSKPMLDAIPEVAIWLQSRATIIYAPLINHSADKANSGNEADSTNRADRADDTVDDFLSVASLLELPVLRNEEDYNSDDIKIITNIQIDATTQALLNIQQQANEEENRGQSQQQIYTESYGGFGYERMHNTYSDDEDTKPSIMVGGRQIRVPKVRQRGQGQDSISHNILVFEEKHNGTLVSINQMYAILMIFLSYFYDFK